MITRFKYPIAPLGLPSADGRIMALDCEIVMRGAIAPVFDTDGGRLVGKLLRVWEGTAAGCEAALWGELELEPLAVLKLQSADDTGPHVLSLEFADHSATCRGEGHPLVFTWAVIGSLRLTPRSQWAWHDWDNELPLYPAVPPLIRQDDPEFVPKVVAGLLDPANAVAPPQPYYGRCLHCGGSIHYLDAPTGGWWAHDAHPADEHDASPMAG